MRKGKPWGSDLRVLPRAGKQLYVEARHSLEVFVICNHRELALQGCRGNQGINIADRPFPWGFLRLRLISAYRSRMG
jgi:hypothetical protein